jgi:methylmalonyl-CoA epimerase
VRKEAEEREEGMTRIHHVGIAVHDAVQATRIYEEALGLTIGHCEVVADQGVRVTCVPIGESEIEFLEPIDESGAVARFLAKRGEGVHHICLEVDDIRAAMASLVESGAHLLCEEPLPGAGGCQVAFVHPRSTNGVLLELSQRPDSRDG